MRAYTIRRLILIVPTLFLVAVIVFSALRFIPGDVIDLMAAEMAVLSGEGTALTAEHLRHAMGLDLPVHIQFWNWLVDAVQGDLGKSLWKQIPVTTMIAERVPVTLELAILSIISALLIALPIGVYSGIRQDTIGDYIGRSFAILAISVPNFWMGTMVVVYPAIWWGWSPSLFILSPFTDLAGNFLQFMIPAFIMGMLMSGTTMRLTRTMMLEVLRQDYIRTAWAKGLGERVIILRHALKNALIPVISMIGLIIPSVIISTVIIEQIFVLPGIGLLLLEALNQRDYPVVSGVVLLFAIFTLTVNLVVDLAYAWLDPRVQYK